MSEKRVLSFICKHREKVILLRFMDKRSVSRFETTTDRKQFTRWEIFPFLFILRPSSQPFVLSTFCLSNFFLSTFCHKIRLNHIEKLCNWIASDVDEATGLEGLVSGLEKIPGFGIFICEIWGFPGIPVFYEFRFKLAQSCQNVMKVLKFTAFYDHTGLNIC